ncbi:type II toxin-antitoxin system prevent-host-death family antitoxin [Cellulomonas sp. JH27-2]|uniref:type II toxin-antitoxin system Phd/YefM family antitoxin n=1 Tax=Cellulomonas sp. JH27-2 TaxID=2774139 RepID=UPI001782F625|nr:type II toxin-antitoxin system prevent-host-death family antitoxin [Cellulomonas sp. JH27-2]MBD8059185.1 type II toxin-antitoxin system prevent-host-death family antitoxin [Cellulomonas sp. JH27-2]
METVGVRELRQNASALLRRVENGERLQVSVSGRHVADLVPAAVAQTGRRTWLTYDEIADVLGTDARLDRPADDELDHGLRDPFATP